MVLAGKGTSAGAGVVPAVDGGVMDGGVVAWLEVAGVVVLPGLAGVVGVVVLPGLGGVVGVVIGTVGFVVGVAGVVVVVGTVPVTRKVALPVSGPPVRAFVQLPVTV